MRALRPCRHETRLRALSVGARRLSPLQGTSVVAVVRAGGRRGGTPQGAVSTACPSTVLTPLLVGEGLEERSLLLFPHVVEERSADVAVRRRGEDDDNHLASGLWPACDLRRRPRRRPRADARENALLTGEPARHRDGIVVADLHDLVDQLGIQNRRNEA